MTKGGFHKAIYALRLKFAVCAHHFFPCIWALLPTYCIFSQIWLRFTLYAVRPTFMKSTLNLDALTTNHLNHASVTFKIN